jgi:hypothetical protein
MQSRRRTTAGIPIGLDSDEDYLGPIGRSVMRAIQIVPPAVARIRDLMAFRYVTLFFLVSGRNLRLVSVWNPSFLQLLLDPIEEWGDELVRDLAKGRISGLTTEAGDTEAIDELQRAAAERKSGSRSIEVAAALKLPSAIERYAALWPDLRLISCWADAEAKYRADELAQRFPRSEIQPKGLLSTEGFVSIPMGDAEGAVLAVRSHYFEFRAIDTGELYLAHEVRRGGRYEIILTNSGGLYRYATGDIIEVTALRGGCPILRFMGRSGIVSDYFGEKLNEAFVRNCLDRVAADLRAQISFAMLAPADATPSAYALFIESTLSDAQLVATTALLDEALKESFHYGYCRRLGQLAALRCCRVAAGAESYLAGCVSAGQRLGDIKPVALHRDRLWSKRFAGRCLN